MVHATLLTVTKETDLSQRHWLIATLRALVFSQTCLKTILPLITSALALRLKLSSMESSPCICSNRNTGGSFREAQRESQNHECPLLYSAQLWTHPHLNLLKFISKTYAEEKDLISLFAMSALMWPPTAMSGLLFHSCFRDPGMAAMSSSHLEQISVGI